MILSFLFTKPLMTLLGAPSQLYWWVSFLVPVCLEETSYEVSLHPPSTISPDNFKSVGTVHNWHTSNNPKH